jgi:excinuclease UvrABC ATPase subunit
VGGDEMGPGGGEHDGKVLVKGYREEVKVL